MAAQEQLLSVLDGIGHVETDEEGKDELFVEETCLESLKDLQRVLRRDDPERAPVKLLLSASGAVHRILVPLILQCQEEREVVLSTLKILVMLTMPIQERGVFQFDLHVKALRDHKTALLRNDFVAILVTLLAEPLQRLQSGGEGEEKTAEDVRTVELVLALLRNLLLVPDGSGVSPIDTTSRMHDDLLRIFYEEQILELLLILVQISEEHRHWSVVLLDIFYLLFRRETPDLLWKDTFQSVSTTNSATTPLIPKSETENALEHLRKEKQRAEEIRASRHGKFYRPIVVKELGSEYILNNNSSTIAPMASSKKKKGAATVISKHRVSRISGNVAANSGRLSAPASKVILRQYGIQFLDSAFTVLLTVVTDFMKTSPTDVLPSDYLNRLWLIYFFIGLHIEREIDECKKTDNSHVLDIAPISIALDLENIFDILGKIEEYDSTLTSPSKSAVTTGILALCKIMQIIHLMINQTSETIKSLGIRIALKMFHDQSILLNRIPFLIARFNPKTRPVKELEALIETGEILLAIVEKLSETGTAVFVQSKRGLNNLKKKNSKEQKEELPPLPTESSANDQQQQQLSLEITPQPTLELPTNQQKEQEQENPLQIPTEQTEQIAKEDEIAEQRQKQEEEEESDSDDGDQALEVMESQLQYSSYLSLYCTNVIVGNYALLLTCLDQLPKTTLTCLTSTLKRFISELPGSVAFFWQLPIFRVFDTMFIQIKTKKLMLNEDIIALRSFIVQVLHDFFEATTKDPSLFIKVFCWRTRGVNRQIVVGGTDDNNNPHGFEMPPINFNELLENEKEPEIIPENSPSLLENQFASTEKEKAVAVEEEPIPKRRRLRKIRSRSSSPNPAGGSKQEQEQEQEQEKSMEIAPQKTMVNNDSLDDLFAEGRSESIAQIPDISQQQETTNPATATTTTTKNSNSTQQQSNNPDVYEENWY